MSETFQLSEKLMAYAASLDDQQLDEPQPDLYYWQDGEGPGGFYPGEEVEDDK